MVIDYPAHLGNQHLSSFFKVNSNIDDKCEWEMANTSVNLFWYKYFKRSALFLLAQYSNNGSLTELELDCNDKCEKLINHHSTAGALDD